MENPAHAPPAARPPRSYQITNIDQINKELSFCPRAQTLIGFRQVSWNRVVICLSCKTWACPICGRRKINFLAGQTLRAKPNRLLTLTVDPKLYPTPRFAFDKTRRCVPELVRCLRKRFGSLEYLRVTELTAKGWPHYHLLVRSPYIPQPVVKDEWANLTGATIVDLRQVKKTLDCYTYLVKYLSKLKHIRWTDRHVSMSRHFIPPDPDRDKKPEKLINCHLVHMHPYKYLLQTYPDRRYTTSDPTSRVEIVPETEFESQQLCLETF